MSRIVFFGTEEFSAPTLRELISQGFDVVAAVTKPDSPRGRGHRIDRPLVAKIADEHNIPVFQPAKLGEITDDLRNLNADAGVLVSYGKIIPQPIIDIFPHGIINVHPSQLPKYRGPSPIESAIANGDTETGISIMALAKEMDAGPVYFCENIALNGTETKPELYEKFSRLGAKLVCEKLPAILSGELAAKPQNDADASYCQLLRKDDGILNPAKMSAAECERKIRAYLGFPKTRIVFRSYEVIVTAAKVCESPSDFTIPCAENSHLEIVALIAPSGKKMSGADFVRGLK